MTSTGRAASYPPWWVLVLFCCGLFSAELRAQTTQGENAVVNQVTPTVTTAPTPSFVDARQYDSTDLCNAVRLVLGNWVYSNSGGVVIDARGYQPQPPATVVQCSGNPWPAPTAGEYQTTVLLPAAPIGLQAGWVIPSSTRVVGVGSGQTSTGSGITVLEPCTTAIVGCQSKAFSGTDMLEMGGAIGINQFCPPEGNGGYDCQALVIEHLQLNGNGLAVNGINNLWAQELSYVNDVRITNLSGTGLVFAPTTANSGPYTKIDYYGSGHCVDMNGVSDTRGIHGLTCNTSASTAMLLDSTNETLEDIQIQATGSNQTGILIGSRGLTAGVVLLNIRGTNGTGGSGLNLIHICGASGVGSCGHNPPSADLTMMGITGIGGGTTPTIKDDLTATTLTDSNISMYVVGEQIISTIGATSGYSKFTTSAAAPTWFVGTGGPTGTCTPGALYSCTSASGCSPDTLYGCTTHSGVTQWVGIR